MKVKQVLEMLKSADPEALVVLAKDAEGNHYSPLAEVDPDNNRYKWRGEIILVPMN